MTQTESRSARVPRTVVAEAEIASRHADAVAKGAVTLRQSAGSVRVGMVRPARDDCGVAVEIVTWRVDPALPSRVVTDVLAIEAGEFATVRRLMEEAEEAVAAGRPSAAAPVSAVRALVARSVAANRAAARIVAACRGASDGERCERERAEAVATARAAGVSEAELRDAVAAVAHWREERMSSPSRRSLA